MPSSLISPNIESLLDLPVMYLANLWEIQRRDGVTLRFTSHNRALSYNGFDYEPAGAFDASAVQHQEGLKEINAEFVGMINADAITTDDLYAGRFRSAKVIERLVDYRWPWRGPIITMTYFIVDTQFTNEQWSAQINGLSVRLQPAIGLTYGRVCYRTLGDSICRINLAALTFSSAVSATTTEKRRVFDSPPINVTSQHTSVTGGTATLANYFRFGSILWTSGANQGLTAEIKRNDGSGRFELQLPMPFDIQVGDTFDATPGCDKTLDACKTKFNNVPNNGSFPFVPGTERANQYPDFPDGE